MKKLISPVLLLAFIRFSDYHPVQNQLPPAINPSHNLFIITLDGFRWQEVFTGADSGIINNEKYTPDTGTIKMMYWAATPQERRQKLMPFFWTVVKTKGQLFGNRIYGNNVNVANSYRLSYPGYSELFTGTTDPVISTNAKYDNPNINVLEYLHAQDSFKNKIAVFTSWDLFPSILNQKRNGLQINSGYKEIAGKNLSHLQQLLNQTQAEIMNNKAATRHDQLTFIAAKEYLQRHQPRVFCLGLGETDEAAHQARYDLYLEKANQADKMIAELWHWVQTTPQYKNNTTFIITTDHGRGFRNWTSHGPFIRGSSQTWIAVIGPGINPAGEVKESGQLYQQQLAQTMARLLGEDFPCGETLPVISLR